MIAEGKSTKMIASELGVSPKTVTNHRTNIYRKKKFASLVDVVKYALRTGLVTMLALSSQAATLEWDRNPEPEVTSYRIWLQSPTGVVQIAQVSTNHYVSTNFNTRSRVGISAVSSNGFESEITWGDNPSNPRGIKLTFTIQSAPSPVGPWADEANTTLVATLPATGFYRGRMEVER